MFLDATTSATTAGSPTRSATDSAQLNDNLNRFLTLLITQLQHQDPLQPMDANEFTQQLVQFASVEQQIYQNANLEKMVAMQKAAQASSLVSYIGKTVEIEGSELRLDDQGANATYTLADQAADTRIVLREQAGNAVLSARGETAQGAHAFTWDGTDANGDPLPAGTYALSVAAVDKDGTPIDVKTRVQATVTGVANDAAETELILGDRRVALAQVLSVIDRSGSPASKTN